MGLHDGKYTGLSQVLIGPVTHASKDVGDVNDPRGEVAITKFATFDPTAAPQDLFTLPKGARVIDVISYGGATGGVSPTVDIGITGAGASLANELPADAAQTSAVVSATGGPGLGAVQVADTFVVAGVGASAATGGTQTVAVVYHLDTASITDPSAY